MVVHLQDYQALFDGEDVTLAVQEALFACAKHPGSTLKLGGGTLHFYPKYALEKEYYISNNDYSRKSILFPLRDMNGITIDGEGAELLCHGTVLPFVVDHSRDVTIQNLSIDYPHPFFFQARIIESKEDSLELEYDPEESPPKQKITPSLSFPKRMDGRWKRIGFWCANLKRTPKLPLPISHPTLLTFPRKATALF